MAELALGKDSSEANLGRLKDIQAQLSALDGIEAAVEGYGAHRGVRAEPYERTGGAGRCFGGRSPMPGNRGGAATEFEKVNG